MAKRRRTRGEVHFTKKGQPYIILASGKARFISKRAAGMSDVGDPSRRKRRKTRRVADLGKKRRLHEVADVAEGMAMISLGEIGKLVRRAGQCATVITSKGIRSVCPARTRR